ncbi:MAG TPA: type II secretion system major pseudopilin GspG [Gemmatimonadaceae bacterium]|nr:type II secretion system major pseudopilin GspG [Gemmatimonadaceae bacterium]
MRRRNNVQPTVWSRDVHVLRTRGLPVRRAFTLIELIVVIAIIATLAAVVAPAIFQNVGDAKVESAKSQIEMLSLALNAYRLDNDAYPSTEQGLAALQTMPITGTLPTHWRGPYLTRVLPNDPWDRPYVYRSPGIQNPKSFDLYSLGKDGKPGGTDEDADITSWGGEVHE